MSAHSVSVTSSTMRMASNTMSMVSGTMSLENSKMSMGSSTTSLLTTADMDMNMHMAGMHMYFTTHWKGYPIIFEKMYAVNGGQAFGIFLALFATGICIKGIEFLRNYLEQVVWKNPNYLDACMTLMACGTGVERSVEVNRIALTDKDTSSSNSTNGCDRNTNTMSLENRSHNWSQKFVSRLFRDFIRLLLCILPEMLGFALMLAAMSFTILYFFAVVLGLGFGRFCFEKIEDKMKIKPIAGTGLHC